MAPARPPDESRSHEQAPLATPTKRKSTASNNSTTIPAAKPTATPTATSKSTSGRPKNAKNLNLTTVNPNPVLTYIAGAGLRTPARRPSIAKNGSPNSPAHQIPRGKKLESTLLEDFLLGRPRPNRIRNGALHKKPSLEAIKTDMRAEVVAKIRAPGKVQDRVRQWQKANAVAEAPEVAANSEQIVVEAQTSDSDTAGEDDRQRIKSLAIRGYGQRKSRSQGRSATPGKSDSHEPAADSPRSRSAAPRKRVVSDSAWVKGKNATAAAEGNAIPKNFLKITALNPPLEKKMQDWIQRTQGEEPAHRKESTRHRNSKQLGAEDSDDTSGGSELSRPEQLNDKCRKKPPDDKRNAAAADAPNTPFKPKQRGRMSALKEYSTVHGIKTSIPQHYDTDNSNPIKSSVEATLDEKFKPQLETTQTNGKRRSIREAESPNSTEKKRSSKSLKLPHDVQSTGASSNTTKNSDPGHISAAYPRPAEITRQKSLRPATVSSKPLNKIPSGKSAFSVLDLPVGAEANTIKRAPPKHSQTGFGVPKVLKKVYKDIIHDAAESPRGGLNQPPSIESWLNKTSDPFVDEVIPPTAVLDVSISSCQGGSDYEGEDYHTEHVLFGKVEKDDIKYRDPEISQLEKAPIDSITVTKIRAALADTEQMPSTRSPAGLKRSPAKRIASSPKVGRKLPLKEAIFSAFHGESAMKKAAASPWSELQEDQSPFKCSPRALKRSASQPAEDAYIPPRSLLRQPTRQSSGNRLPTIPSVESFSTSSSISDTASEYSQTTVTHGTVYTAPAASIPSRKSQNSSSHIRLNRRLTKHKDLMSMLSLPDTSVPGRAGSIRSARSLRAKVGRLETATVDTDLMELGADEMQYVRELNTLVDGVIPVLLVSVLSKSESAVAAGFFDPLFRSTGETNFTQPIIDMGIALEELRSQHQKMPLIDAHALLLWADTARHTYEKYIRTWRSGFEDLVVNLTSTSTTSPLGDMRRDENGDLIGDHGEKVVVANLLKKPLLRIKHINRALKCLAHKIVDEGEARRISDDFNAVAILSKKRNREERARMEDRAAWMTETARARSLASLDLASNVEINKLYQVVAKDCFSMELSHSSGQRVNCGVELILRKLPGQKNEGDLLVLKTDSTERFLLFEPIARHNLSARLGLPENQIVVMVQGLPFSELLVLDADDNEVAIEWIKMLGTSPVPPPVVQNSLKIDPILGSVMATPNADTVSVIEALREIDTSQVPIGERAWQEADNLPDAPTGVAATREMKLWMGRPMPMTILWEDLNQDEIDLISEDHVIDANLANDLLSKKGLPAIISWTPGSSHRKPSTDCLMSGALNPEPKEYVYAQSQANSGELGDEGWAPSEEEQGRTHKDDDNSSLTQKNSANFFSSSRKTSRDDGAPPPPVHRTPIPDSIKNVLVLESPTPKAKHIRTSSPLKNEYQASTASGTSSSDKMSDSDDYSSSEPSSSEEDEESYLAEAIATEILSDIVAGKAIPPNLSLCSLPRDSVAVPDQLASQALPPSKEPAANLAKFIAMISQWNGVKGRWVDLHQDLVLIHVTDGLIESFDLSSSPPLSQRFSTAAESSMCSTAFLNYNADIGQIIIKQSLTPVVQVRQSTAIDIEIKSDIFTTRNSGISKATLQVSNTVRYRTLNSNDCVALYSAVHHSRLRNEVYLRLEEEARIKRFGSHAYDQAVAARNHQRSLFGLRRKRSYRASTRTLSETPSDYPFPKWSSSPMSTLRRLSGGGIFNISQSFVENSSGGSPRCSSRPLSSTNSMYTSSSYSGAITPPRTPNSHTGNSDSIYSTGFTVHNLGSRNISFRLYCRMKSGNWDDRGHAYLTVSAPPPDMKQRAPMDHGPRRRITITKSRIPNGEDIAGADLIAAGLILDEVLGAELFKGLYHSGIVFQTWQDVDDGQQGGVRSFGGVGTKRRMWCLQFRRAGDQQWCLQLCRSGEV